MRQRPQGGTSPYVVINPATSEITQANIDRYSGILKDFLAVVTPCEVSPVRSGANAVFFHITPRDSAKVADVLHAMTMKRDDSDVCHLFPNAIACGNTVVHFPGVCRRASLPT